MTIEAMKMEHLHIADVAGVVRAVSVAEGEQVRAAPSWRKIEAARRV